MLLYRYDGVNAAAIPPSCGWPLSVILVSMRQSDNDIITIEAPAKVNLCLSVKYPPQDGYHQLDSVFYELALHDVLHVQVTGIDDCIDSPQAACTRRGTTVALDCGALGVATADNLIFKAVDALEQAFKRDAVAFDQALRITVDKHIPAGGGLGGGSSDAASTIKTLCGLWGVTCDDERVTAVAKSLGADVAFFLCGGTALMKGRGDELSRKLASFPLPVVLMGDSQPMPTKAVYAAFDENPQPAPCAQELADYIDAIPAWGATIDQKRELARLCANNLEPAVLAASSSIARRIQTARQDPDVLNALVTGSGATSFAICADEGAAMRFERRAAAYCDWICVC